MIFHFRIISWFIILLMPKKIYKVSNYRNSNYRNDINGHPELELNISNIVLLIEINVSKAKTVIKMQRG
jgi:hypothetical protein